MVRHRLYLLQCLAPRATPSPTPTWSSSVKISTTSNGSASTKRSRTASREDHGRRGAAACPTGAAGVATGPPPPRARHEVARGQLLALRAIVARRAAADAGDGDAGGTLPEETQTMSQDDDVRRALDLSDADEADDVREAARRSDTRCGNRWWMAFYEPPARITRRATCSPKARRRAGHGTSASACTSTGFATSTRKRRRSRGTAEWRDGDWGSPYSRSGQAAPTQPPPRSTSSTLSAVNGFGMARS